MKKKLFIYEIKENIFIFLNMVFVISLFFGIMIVFSQILYRNVKEITSDEYLKTYEITSLSDIDEVIKAAKIIGLDNIDKTLNIDAMREQKIVRLIFDGELSPLNYVDDYMEYDNSVSYNSIEDKRDIITSSLIVQTKSRLTRTQIKELERFDEDLTNVYLYNKYKVREKLIVLCLYTMLLLIITVLCIRNIVGIYRIYEDSNMEKYNIYVDNGADKSFIKHLKMFFMMAVIIQASVVIFLFNIILRQI